MPLAFLDKSRSVAPAGYSRWLIPPAALCVHLSIGQVYAFSVFKTPLQGRFDTSATAVAVIFSIAIVMLGLSAAVLGTWVERSGPRKAMFAAALCWGTGFLVGALGIAVGSIWLLYLGYGVIGGIGLGIGYISPVSTLIKWFPDRPGLATGMAIMGFGGGALIASPASTALLTLYGGDASTTDAAPLASTFLTLGLVYLVFMLIGSALIRVAPGYEDDATAEHQPGRNGALVRASEAIRTRQFWALWVILFCNVTAGIGILEQAAPMIQDFFREGGESSVTPAAAAGFVGMLSLANMAGRFVWSTTSDKIGRKPTYMMYLGVGAVLYLLMATLGQTSVVLFVVLAMVILSYYGGGFATIPAYLKDMFGTLEVGAIHGRLLTAWAAAGVAGPLIVNGFLDAAGEPGSLVASDYYPALLTMVGLLVVGFLANLTVTPLSADHTDQDAARRAGVEPGSGADQDQDRTASTSGGSR